jgi:hypothetical protein
LPGDAGGRGRLRGAWATGSAAVAAKRECQHPDGDCGEKEFHVWFPLELFCGECSSIPDGNNDGEVLRIA